MKKSQRDAGSGNRTKTAGNGPTREEGGLAIRMLPVGRIRPNDYNPNEMSEKDLADFVAEVKRLKRLPRPLVVREAKGAFVLVDGQHGLEAAKKAGLKKVPCEAVKEDDFEGMRQSFQRNRHGEMNQVKLGLMFRRMMEGRKLSKRGLAKEVGVAEGTIRNVLAYAEAFDARSCSEPADAARKRIARLSVKQVQHYMALPEDKRDAWLESGAELPRPKAKTGPKDDGEPANGEPANASGEPAKAGETDKAATAQKEAKEGKAVVAPGSPEDKVARFREAWKGLEAADRKKCLADLLVEPVTRALVRKLLAAAETRRKAA